MSKKKSYLTATDGFCGAGGSAQGAKKAGVKVLIGLNHWKQAIDTYSLNNPETDVDCTDISACDPRRYPSTDIGIWSPECTTHSPAGGNNHKALKKQMEMFSTGKIDPSTERSRATMWDVCRFAEYHQYNCLIVENVVEAKTRWALFDVWLMAMHKLGYMHRCVYLNSMHCHPTPQSRDRMYIVFWKKGNKAPNLNYMPLAFCSKCGIDVHAVQTWKNQDKQYGKYRQQYVYCCPACTSIVEPYYYASFNCIDWSDRGTRIGDRKKALSPNTIKRINYGREKYGKQPLLVTTKYHSEDIQFGSRSTTEALRTQTSEQAHAVFNPFIVNTLNAENDNTRHRSTFEASFAQTTYNGQMLINHPFIIDNKQNDAGPSRVRSISQPANTLHCDPRLHLVLSPFIIKGEQTSCDGYVRNSMDVLQTQTVRQSMSLVSSPFLTEMYSGGKAREITDEIKTATAGGIKTGIVTNESWNSFISYYYGTSQASGINEAINTVRTGDCHQLISYKEPELEDCYYRMLKPPEIKAAMAFENDYKILGSGRDQVKQCGNAVTPPAMEWLVQQVVNSLS